MNINWGLIGCGRIANNRVIPEGILDAKNSSLIGVSDVILNPGFIIDVKV